MAKILTTAANLTCGHNGTVTLAPAGGKLKAQTTEALTAAMVVGAIIAGCATPVDVPSGSKPCTVVATITAGPAAKMKTGGQPVLLDTLAGTTDGTIGGVIQALLAVVTPGQSKLNAG